MGRFVNPGNDGFSGILRGEYVDKTGLVSLFDSTLGVADKKLVMVSRPRRFGKSYAAHSLVAFYSCGCDSRGLFEGLAVSKRAGWDSNLNQYNVVQLDMTEVIQQDGVENVASTLEALLVPELREEVGMAGAGSVGRGGVLASALWDVAEATGRRFVFVIDEWDAPYRLARDHVKAQVAYAEWLRGLFKGSSLTPRVIAGAFMTGILPIKKYDHQSAISDFREYTMVSPGPYAPYVGFVEGEVECLCSRHGLDLAEVRRWYDGYDLEAGGKACPVFAPYSLMRACEAGRAGSFWPSTESFALLREYIEMNFDGLQDDIVRAVGGAEVRVDPNGFQNDMVSIESKDDVLTLLVHLGYLTYDTRTNLARVPNEEVRAELARSVRRSRHPKLVELMRESSALLRRMVAMDEEAVATGIARVHEREASALFYNNEQALRAVVKSALVAAVDEYARVEELPGGRGFADVAYLPARGSMMPAMVVELKWNRPTDAAVGQIRAKRYAEVLRGLDVPVLLVGVVYDPRTREHSCRIELLGERDGS